MTFIIYILLTEDIDEDEIEENQITMMPWNPQEKQWSREDDSGRKTPKLKMFSELSSKDN